jgi:hypothetical protein
LITVSLGRDCCRVWLTPLLWIEVHEEDVRCAEEVPAQSSSVTSFGSLAAAT